MSLYGSGRSEGIGAVCLIALLVVVVHCLGSAQVFGLDTDLVTASWSALVPALAGVLCYRFLRAQGRSRYAAFLAGLAYAWSPWLVSMAIAPREQVALALAPLALEAVCRCDRPSARSTWLPWTGFCIGAPFLAGASVVAGFAAALAVTSLVHTVTCGDRDDERPPARGILLAAVCGAVCAGSLAWLDALSPWLGQPTTTLPGEVLYAYRPGRNGLDVAAILRVPGPVLLLFAGLGCMRQQRHVSTCAWLTVAFGGTVPTLFCLLPWTPPDWSDAAHSMPMLLLASWWLVLFGITVLGAAGLDDFLDLPMRRRTALAWLLAIAVAVSPLVPAFGACVPELEWPLTATFLLFAVLLPTWRRLGILRFKNVLAIAAVMALAIPLLQVLPIAPTTIHAAPAGESSPPAAWTYLATRPLVPSVVLSAVLALSCGWALSCWRRRIHARPAPSAARAAIKKKARPAKRS